MLWHGINDDGTGRPKGLWRFLVSRVYGSTSGKPSTHSSAIMGVSKFVPKESEGKHIAPKPKAQVWNPQFIELLVAAMQNGDQPEHWAALTHNLRDAAPYVRNTMILPWPLHLAKQLEEYLLPTKVSGINDIADSESAADEVIEAMA